MPTVRRSLRAILAAALLLAPFAFAVVSPHLHAPGAPGVAGAGEICVICSSGGAVADGPSDAPAVVGPVFVSAAPACSAPAPRCETTPVAPPERGPPMLAV